MTRQEYHTILDYLASLIKGTKWENHVFAVGGCCRDDILGEEINDIDLAVDLPGGGVDFAGFLHKKGETAKKPVLFAKFGTAKLVLSKFPEHEIETVQTRREKYTDKTKRDPTIVFGTVEEDCIRRDLTVNALYHNVSKGTLSDILGCSLSDIQAHIIRTPADPDITFEDDPVRILRTIRFSARYGWEIEAATYKGMIRNIDRLQIVTKERMAAELEKMLCGPHPAKALELLRVTGAMKYIIPEMCATYAIEQNDYHFGTVWEHTLAVVEKVPAIPVLRMAALLHDIGKTVTRSCDKNGRYHFYGHEKTCKRLIDIVLRRLHFDSDFINKVIFLAYNHMATKKWGPRAERMSDANLRKLQHMCASPERLERLLSLIDADNRSHAHGHCMPEQCEQILLRSQQLRKEGSAMFSYHQPLQSTKIRKVAGLTPDDDLEPYRKYLFELVCANPAKGKAFYERKLRAYTPPKPGRRRNKR